MQTETISVDKSELSLWRRHFHQYPELSNQEKSTSEYVASLLRSFGLRVEVNVGGYGVIARLIGPLPGPTIAFRADMDALPIQEIKAVSYASKIDGVMHACGHDGHMAMLLGAAKLLAKCRNDIRGEIRFIFQPAEELMPGGAIRMIEHGCLKDVDFMYGVHLWSGLPTGTIAIRPGPVMASSDFFDITLHGKGGHGGMPHNTVDPVVVGMEIVQQFQHIVSRRTNPISPVVVTVGSFHAGTANNVIADEAVIAGTVRCFDGAVRGNVEQLIQQCLRGVCTTYNAGYELTYTLGCPPVVNEAAATEALHASAKRLNGVNVISNMEPLTVGEDFSRYLERVPGCFAFVGCGNSEKQSDYPHHHSCFNIDEDALENGTRLFVRAALDIVGTSSAVCERKFN